MLLNEFKLGDKFDVRSASGYSTGIFNLISSSLVVSYVSTSFDLEGKFTTFFSF